MGKVQKRRSVSMSPQTFFRLQNYCKANGLTVAGYVERLIRKDLDRPVVIAIQSRIHTEDVTAAILKEPSKFTQLELDVKFENGVLDNPCRDPKCRRVAAHAAH